MRDGREAYKQRSGLKNKASKIWGNKEQQNIMRQRLYPDRRFNRDSLIVPAFRRRDYIHLFDPISIIYLFVFNTLRTQGRALDNGIMLYVNAIMLDKLKIQNKTKTN